MFLCALVLHHNILLVFLIVNTGSSMLLAEIKACVIKLLAMSFVLIGSFDMNVTFISDVATFSC